MNKNVLTVLGCSSSLALMLLTANSAQARTVDGNNQKAIEAALSQDEPQSSLEDASSDKIGDLAIIALGCDCAGCRSSVSQMVEQGRLMLPQ